MSLSFEAQEATVRAFIDADVLTAWTAKKIYHAAPETVTDAAGLPIAFIEIADPTEDEDYSSVRHTGVRLEYTITGRFAKPEVGMNLHSLKMAKANALRSLLTTGPLYHNYNREWLGDNYSVENTEDESTGNDYKVSVRFLVIILVEVG